MVVLEVIIVYRSIKTEIRLKDKNTKGLVVNRG
jgi:hypothetical protein